MHIYIMAIVWAYILLIFKHKLPMALRLFVIIPLICFSVFRGASGPDTLSYYHKYLNIGETISDHLSVTGEPVTYLMMHFSLLIGNDWLLFCLIYAVIISLFYCSLVNRYYLYRVFLLTVGPVLLIDGLVNTVRVTLAYFFFLVAFKNRKYWLYWMLAFLSHVSALILIAGQCFSQRIKVKVSIKNVLLILFSLIFIFILLSKFELIISYFPRIQDKLTQYDTFKTQSSLSGLSDIFVIFCLLILSSYYNRTLGIEFFLDVLLAILFSAVLYIGAMYSIGFMRLLKLIIIILSVSPMLIQSRRHIPSLLFFIIGFLYSMNYLRIVMQGDGYLPFGQGLS